MIKIITKIDPRCSSEWHQFFYGEYEPYVETIAVEAILPMVKRYHATTIAQDLVSIQPMEAPMFSVDFLMKVFNFNLTEDDAKENEKHRN